MRRRWIFGLLVVGAALAGAGMAVAGSDALNRLDRFRELAASRLGTLELFGPDPSPEGYGEIYALLDDEIVESLASGGPFASEGFLQERLDGFSEAWGGTAFRIMALQGGTLTVGAFQLSPGGSGSSVRIYGRTGDGAALLRAISREGIPALYAMPPTRTGDPQFLVAWVGPQTGRGTAAFGIELWRGPGESVRLVWSADSPGGERLLVRAWSVRGQEAAFRYEVRYPGWKPGCERQTEQEDLYRYVPARETFTLVRREVHEAWHRQFQTELSRFFGALRAGDSRTLVEMVPDGALRARLPARLEADASCDGADGVPPSAVSVAAVSPADGRPWTLVFRRAARGWRLAAAGPLE